MKVTENIEFIKKCKEMAEELDFNLYDIVLYDNGEVYRYEHQKANACNNSYSISKMFTMAAIGFCVDEGKLSLDDKVMDILRDEITYDYDKRWDEVTVFQALGHKTGVADDYLNIYGDDTSAIDTEDFLSIVMRLKIVYDPGTYYKYTDDIYYMLSRIVSKVTGEKMLDYLKPRLFNPLRFFEVAWSACPWGYQLGGDCLYCKTEDMLKLGIIFLNGGVFEGRRYLSEEFVKTAIENDLGMLPCEAKSHGKTGSRGQIVAFCKETNKALAIHAYQCGSYDFRGAAIREFLEK
ncbi:MAG: serine hydrolase [Clostridia bacterium]|nr:serine hydrolase [Clostridia bacterium]